MEVLAIARKRKFSIAQIPIEGWEDKPDGAFETEMGTAAVETLGELLLIRWQMFTGKYRNTSFNYEPHQ